MVLQVVNTTLTNAAVPLNLGAFDSALIGRDGLVVSTGGNNAILATGTGQWVRVEGTVMGVNGIAMGDVNNDSAHRVFLTETGYVAGTTYGVKLTAFQSGVTNFGMIEGQFGIYYGGSNSSSISFLRNEGTIIASNTAVTSAGFETLSIVNTGNIIGTSFAVVGSILNDTVRNRGDISGVIDLGNGADSYDGRGGRVEGQIRGGEGNDTFRVGAGQEDIDGGNGIDTLDFRLTNGVTVALDVSVLGTGDAAGDVYIGIENLQGSNNGKDVLFGSAANNVINSYGGLDKIVAGLGDDSIAGGMNNDTLTGGLGNDRFYFNALSDAGDVITDFSNVAFNDDILQISLAGFGGGMTAGALAAGQFVARTDRFAQDADDRFIFDTNTHKLWYDADGNGSGSSVVLATFQVGAVLTAADFFIG